MPANSASIAARLAVAGSSAGATLAASLAQEAADGALPPVVFQLLHQPVLDDRATLSKKEFRTSPAFDGEAAELMWAHYLGRSDRIGIRRARAANPTRRPAAGSDHVRGDRSLS